MKKMLLTLTMLLGISIAQDKYRIFYSDDNISYELGKDIEDVDKDGRYDTIVLFYDFNHNGKKDAEARYVITSVSSDTTIDIDNRAYSLMIDRDEDGFCEEIFVDLDGNGTLETKLFNTNKLFKKVKNEENINYKTG